MAAFKNLQIKKAERVMNLLEIAVTALEENSRKLKYNGEREMRACFENYKSAAGIFENDLTAFCTMFANVIDETNDRDAIATLVDYLIDGTVQD